MTTRAVRAPPARRVAPGDGAEWGPRGEGGASGEGSTKIGRVGSSGWVGADDHTVFVSMFVANLASL